MSSFAYGRLTREREKFSPKRESDLDKAMRLATDPGAPADEVKDSLAKASRSAGGGAPGGEVPTKPTVGSYVDAVAAFVPSEALVFFAAASSFAGLVNVDKAQQGNGVATKVESIADIQGAIWLIVLSMLCSVALFVIGKFGMPWNGMDFVRMLIPPLAFLLWLVMQEGSMFWMLWDRSEDLPGWMVPETIAMNAYVVKVSAVFGAVVLPLLAGALGIVAQQQEPATGKPAKSGRKAQGGDAQPVLVANAETSPAS